jgi:hypothetical protein
VTASLREALRRDAMRHENELAPYVNQEEVLRLAERFVASRPKHFTVEALFTAMLRSGGVFHDGLACRIVVRADGTRLVFVQHTGELIAQSAPGLPLKALNSPRRRKRA